jgi:uncharacterized membrane protein
MASSVDRPSERMVFFSDAVVAIALTLLILPLADAVPEAAGKYADSYHLITENQGKIYSFLLSFVVIARLWVAHHRLFERVKAYNRRLMQANFGWLLTIVVLPFPTEMIGKFHDDRFTASFYIATVLAANVLLFTMIMIVRGDPGLARNDEGIPDRQRFGAGLTMGLLAVAFVLAAAVPNVGYFAILLLLLTSPISWIWDHRHPAETLA